MSFCLNVITGYFANQTTNSNGVDLLTNFPSRFFTETSEQIKKLHQVETSSYINFVSYYNFALSANIQSGDLVVRYPYDSNKRSSVTYTTTPDDSLFKHLATSYSQFR